MLGTCTVSSPGAIGLGARRRSARLRVRSARPRVRFAHRSERRFAGILDFYRLRWEYEPHTFPLHWSDDGRPIESFTPDFWLPEIGTYVELTTSRRRMVTRKNRRLRRFRELHPEKHVRVLYRRDLEQLATKYAST